MRGRLGVMIGLDFDDDAADAVEQQGRADQVGRDLCTLRSKNERFSGLPRRGAAALAGLGFGAIFR